MCAFKHNINRIIEACAEELEKKLGFNQSQVIRFFEIFPLGDPPSFNQIPLKERENWYYLRDRHYHSALLFNYETREYRLINKEYDWREEVIEKFQKSDEELQREKEIYEKEMEEILQSFVYKNLQSMINWYFSCPNISLGRILPTPKEFLLTLLQKNQHWLKIKDDENLENLRDSLLEAFHYEERNKEQEKHD